MNRYITELIGTFFLVLTIAFTGNPIAIGLVLTALVYMGGHISGAHYNPAVSLAIYLRKKISAKDVLIYWLFQIIGAALAAIMFLSITKETFAPAPNPNISMLSAIVIEFVFTFALILVVLNVATTQKNAGNSYFGLAIGATILGAAFAGGPFSGGAYNPAVAIGPAIVDTINGGNSISNLIIYLIGPFLASLTAPFVFKFMNPEEYQDLDLQYHEEENSKKIK
ncbi:MAG: aquaporin family protein [Ignavibacteriae bacterium]|nr:aquaporin family protein [Ignavibacteriota bacterium]MCB9243135.1 aquaporin family protein [Ignavibacteriales bacterium]